MSYFTSSEDWQRQSALLLQARPTTTRITTKYHIPNLSSSRLQKKLSKRASSSTTTNTTSTTTAEKTPRAYLELKTYDPVSGTTLKYKTNKAAEVGRLIGSLGRLSRYAAALPPRPEEESAAVGQDVEMKEGGSGSATPAVEGGMPIGEASAAMAQQQQQQQQGKAVGGKGKKKKGKR